MTQQLGLIDMVGAFLAETNFWTQIEADLRSLTSLFLGLILTIVRISSDVHLFFQVWQNVHALLVRLLVIKRSSP